MLIFVRVKSNIVSAAVRSVVFSQAVALDVYAHTEVEVTVHQEAHHSRGEGAIR